MTPETAEIDPTVDRPEIVVVQIPPHLADTNATVLQTDLAETIVVRALSAQRATTRVGATHVLTDVHRGPLAVQIPPHPADTSATVRQTDHGETIVVRALSAQRATTRVGATYVLTVDRPEIVVARRGMLEIVVRVCLHGLRVPQIAPEFAINDRAVTPISAVVVRGS